MTAQVREEDRREEMIGKERKRGKSKEERGKRREERNWREER